MSEITAETSDLEKQGAHATVPVGVEPVRLWYDRKMCRGVLVRAAKTNTVPVYIGTGAGVTADLAVTAGLPLSAGESITIPADSPATVYAVATAPGQYLHWIGV